MPKDPKPIEIDCSSSTVNIDDFDLKNVSSIDIGYYNGIQTMKTITKMTSISLWAKHLISFGAHSSVFSVQSNRTISMMNKRYGNFSRQ